MSVFRQLSCLFYFIVDLAIADDVGYILRAKHNVRSTKAVITKLKSVKFFFISLDKKHYNYITPDCTCCTWISATAGFQYITDYQSIWTIFFKSQEWYLLIGCDSSLCKHVTLVNVSIGSTRTRVIIQIGRALLVKLCWMHDERWISLDRKGCFYSQYFFISYLPTYSSSESPCDKISVLGVQ